MSGGHFDGDQHLIGRIVDIIKEEIEINDTYNEYSSDTIERFKVAIDYLILAQTYAHRIDYLISGDDSEESFHKRLTDELVAIVNPNHTITKVEQ